MSTPFSLGILQCHLQWQDLAANASAILSQVRSAPRADLWVLPEMALTGFTMTPDGLALNQHPGLLDRFIGVCAEMETTICGSFIWKDGSSYSNRFLVFGPGGIMHHYDKHHLFTFSGEDRQYAKGSARSVFEVAGLKIAPFICYDLRFPEWCANDHGADLMLFVANWPKQRIHHWTALLKARAIENQCFVAGVNCVGEDGNHLTYNGQSQCLDADGTVLFLAEDREGPSTVALDRAWLEQYRKKLPFLKDRFATPL